MMKKTFAVLAVLAMTVQPLAAQPAGMPQGMPIPTPMAAPAEPGAIPLYGDKTPGSAATEVWSSMGVRNVSRPTLTPFLPKPGKGNGAAVIVAPGGAFMMLSMEKEGWAVAKALADRGIAAFVLKYRLIETPNDNAEAMRFVGQQMMKEVGKPMEGELIKRTKAPEDARAAFAMVRANAAKWKIDPARVGIIGFSAGAMTARRAALDGDPAGRPNFVGYIYGPQDAEPVPADAPPLFNAIAMDDMLFPSKGFPIAAAWHAAKRPVETHAYQSGNHGFGLGQPGTTHAMMLNQFVTWLAMNTFLTPTKK
ncbi:alpha/beta hydrolase [Novosphingobium aquae]|jgi:acetyl esterase/lipase|uniref:Alpha/beta hydrolase n=1 Tax=Novosphingobium aquae TaxID=3133435 RepID=A0ABU8S4L6_9SPHN